MAWHAWVIIHDATPFLIIIIYCCIAWCYRKLPDEWVDAEDITVDSESKKKKKFVLDLPVFELPDNPIASKKRKVSMTR